MCSSKRCKQAIRSAAAQLSHLAAELCATVSGMSRAMTLLRLQPTIVDAFFYVENTFCTASASESTEV
jgi:hypothetical protein